MKRISSIFTVSLLVLILGLTGCGLQKTGTQKVRDLDYTVVTEQELPEELQKEIDERYTEDFKMTCMLDCAWLWNAGDRRIQYTGSRSVSGAKCDLF